MITGDGHWGNGKDLSDDMMTAGNEMLYRQIILDHFEDGYSHIDNGDGPELLENHINAVLEAYGNTLQLAGDCYPVDFVSRKKLRIGGNHDPEKRMRKKAGAEFYKNVIMPPVIRLGDAGFITHGFLGDWWCDTASPFTRWVIWNIWRHLQNIFGWSSEPRHKSYFPSKNEVRGNALEQVWVRLCREWDLLGVFSHLHMSTSIGKKYINTGSLLVPGRVYGVLITGRRVEQIMWERVSQSNESPVKYKTTIADVLYLIDRKHLEWKRRHGRNKGWKQTYFTSEGGDYLIAKPPRSQWKLWGETYRTRNGNRRPLIDESSSINKLKALAEQHKQKKQKTLGKT